MTRKLHPELSFDEVALIVSALREVKLKSAIELSARLHSWAVHVVDCEASFKKSLLDLTVEDRL